MNERIRELAEQAMVSISYRVCKQTFREIEDPEGPLVKKEFSKEKFAKLIVQECIKMMDTNISGVFNSDWDFETQAKFVKKQFGVDQ